MDEIQEWFDSRTKPWMATVQPVPEELPEEGPSAVGHFLFSVSPLLEAGEEQIRKIFHKLFLGLNDKATGF